MIKCIKLWWLRRQIERLAQVEAHMRQAAAQALVDADDCRRERQELLQRAINAAKSVQR